MVKKKTEEKQEENKKIKKIKANFSRENVIAEKNNESNELYQKSRFGEIVGDKYQYSLVEALYLLEKKRMQIKNSKNKIIKAKDFMKEAKKIDKNFFVRYSVFKDLRSRGYIVKTALKFGADFRVYDRGIKPGEDHAKWIVYPVHESTILTWYEFSAKNRVAHSTRKSLLIGVVDDEGEVSYWNVNWVRP